MQFAQAGETVALILKVHDGDTLTLLIGKQPVKIRIAEIDAPEQGQPFYRESGDTLRALCEVGRQAVFRQTGYDARNERPVGRVVCRQTDAGSHQVLNGMAWVWPLYVEPTSPLYPLAAAAIGARRGLWAQEAPQAPWEFRAERSASTKYLRTYFDPGLSATAG